MYKQITIELQDALFNASVLGFVRVLEYCDVEYKVEGSSITIDRSVLDNFHEHYFRALIGIYKRECSFYDIQEKYKLWMDDVEKDVDDNLKKFLESAFKNLESASYKAGYEIIKNRGEQFPFEEEIKTAKKEKEVKDKLQKLGNILERMKKYEDVFLLKNIMYTKINKYWGNMAFLLSTNNKKEIVDCFEERISKGVREIIKDGYKRPKSGVICSQCGDILKKSQMESMAWLNDVGVDTSRKLSNYWNYKSDTNICPICTMIYTCLPLGFTIKGHEGIFINANYSIQALHQFNLTIASKIESGEAIINDKKEAELYYIVLNNFFQIVQNISKEYSLDNVQVIRRLEDRYIYNVLSKNILEILRKQAKNLELRAKISAKVNKKEWVNLYREILETIWQGRNIYNFLNKVIQYYVSVKDEKQNVPTTGLFTMLVVQKSIQNQSKGDDVVKDGILYVAKDAGSGLREYIKKGSKSGDSDNKVRSVSYNLTNSLRTINKHDFIDVLIRQYVGLGIEVPSILVKMLADDDEMFLNLGYAFVLGLNADKKQITEKEAGGEA